MSTIIKVSTKRGEKLYASAVIKKGVNLRDVYSSYSRDKEDAYNNCLKKYIDTPMHCEFRICSANSWSFTVSWRGEYNGEPAMFIETKSNSYIILLNK